MGIGICYPTTRALALPVPLLLFALLIRSKDGTDNCQLTLLDSAVVDPAYVTRSLFATYSRLIYNLFNMPALTAFTCYIHRSMLISVYFFSTFSIHTRLGLPLIYMVDGQQLESIFGIF